MKFLGFEIGSYKKPVVIAEISCNHEGSMDSALTHIREAKLAGADIVKIQAYTPDEMTISTSTSEHHDFYCQSGPWKGKHLYDLYTKTATPLEWLPGLFNYAKEIQMPMFSSVFGMDSLDALERAGCPAYKIASFEIGDIELITEVARCEKPMVLSTGCGTDVEIYRAHNASYEPILMHCVSKYPTEFRLSELGRIIKHNYLGYSDHTKSSMSAQMAYAMGVCLFEKHFSMSHTSEDASFSLNKFELQNYIRDLNCAQDAVFLREGRETNQYKRSLYVTRDIQKGAMFTTLNVRSIRPGYGLSPIKYSNVLRKRATQDLTSGTALKEEHYE